MIIVNAIQGSAEWWAARYGVVTASGAGKIIQPGAPPRAPRWFAMTDSGAAATFRGSVQISVQKALTTLEEQFGPGVDERAIPGGVSPTLRAMIERGQVVEVDPPADVEPIQEPLRLSAQRERYMHLLLAEWRLQRPVSPFQGNYWTERGHEGEAPAADAFYDITGMIPSAVGFIYKDDTRLVGCSPDWVVYDSSGEEIIAAIPVLGDGRARLLPVRLPAGARRRRAVPAAAAQGRAGSALARGLRRARARIHRRNDRGPRQADRDGRRAAEAGRMTWTPDPDVRPDFATLLVELDDGAEIGAGRGLDGQNWLLRPSGESFQVHYGTMLALERHRWLMRGEVIDDMRRWRITKRGRLQAAYERGKVRPTLRERVVQIMEMER
jgi:hypothetical protein